MRRPSPYKRVILVITWTLTSLIGLGLIFAASPQLERAVLTSEAVRDASPLSESEALERHSDVRDYLFGNAATIDGASENEISHMHDVKRLFETLAGVALLSAAIGFGTLRSEPAAWSRQTIRDVCLSVTGVVLSGLLIGAFAFTRLFTEFHFLFFPQGNWTFAADSYLITLYPQIFFAQMAAAIAVLVLIVSAVGYVLTRTPRP